jgi:hypothetical protein
MPIKILILGSLGIQKF